MAKWILATSDHGTRTLINSDFIEHATVGIRNGHTNVRWHQGRGDEFAVDFDEFVNALASTEAAVVTFP